MHVRLALPLAAAAALLLPAPAHAAPSVTFQPTSLVLGQQVRVTLTGATARVGDAAALQEKIGGSWSRIQRKVVREGGMVTFWERPETVGVHWYRIVVPGTGRKGTLVSGAQAIPVRQWRYLADLAPSSTGGPNGVPQTGPVTINDRSYPRSVQYVAAPEVSFTEWTLPPRCTEFRSVLGLAMGSATGSEADLAVLFDGVEQNLDWEQPTMGVGDQNSVVLPGLAGKTTLRLEHQEVAGDPRPAFGNARILCAS